MWTKEEKCLLWLDSFPLEPVKKQALIAAAGSALALVKSFSLYAKDVEPELAERMQTSLSDGEYFSELQAGLEKEKITPVFYGGEGYPEGWLTLADAPLCLYAKGDLGLLQEKRFAVVGSRRTTEIGRKTGKKIAEALTAHFAVVTGSADGGDEAALSGALAGGKAICLLAGGFGSVPKENPLLSETEKKGLLLAACPYDTPVRTYSYEYRNKLLAAACEGGLVLGAAKKSGSLITAKYLKAQGKKLFAIPYSPSVAAGEGCNALIKDGAFLTERAEDIFSQYGITVEQKPKPTLSDTESAVFKLLQGLGEAHLSEIAKDSGIPIFKLTAILSSLEVKGAAVKLGGNRYAAV
ncbi:MAG: DNA-processing protein DprA [Clostridiales bacterium]|nr:DNA-processing protein DprA [Clostridiales bacterium]